jgi:hypothetical protein
LWHLASLYGYNYRGVSAGLGTVYGEKGWCWPNFSLGIQ